MDLDSPTTLIAAWALVPALIALCCAGLGLGLGRLCGLALGSLTLPAGFMAGIVALCALFALGVHGGPAAVGVTLLAVAGWAFALVPRLGGGAGAIERRALVWPAAAALGAYLVSLAPLAGTGRSGIVGYVLNDDTAVHLSLIELVREFGGRTVPDITLSSYHFTGAGIIDGYPLGSHAWVLWGSVIGRVEAFHLWTPVLALCAGLVALVSFSLLRDLGAGPRFAAPAAAVVAIGYLPFSYLAQGGLKEVAMGLCVYATVALFVRGFSAGVSWRTLLPAALGTVAAFDVFGLGAGAWLAPFVLLAVGALLIRPPAALGRARSAGAVAIAGAIAALPALPPLLKSIDFTSVNSTLLASDGQVGNLLDADGIPAREALNVWLSGDYRIPEPDERLLTALGGLLAAGLAVAGIVYALRRRRPGIPLALATGLAGAAIVVSRYAIYFDAKAYMILAIGLGLASAAGVAWLIARSPKLGIAVAVALAALVVAGDVFVYLKAYTTPKERFEELADIGERFAGRGPILVNERENHSKYLLRDLDPWESWGAWQPRRGVRGDIGPVIPKPTHTPDFDDYAPGFLARFPLLLERRTPTGSTPPSNYRVVHESPRYRIWERSGRAPAAHLPVGSPGAGSAPLDCRRPEVRRFLADARRQGSEVSAARPRPGPVTVPNSKWTLAGGILGSPARGLVSRRDTAAFIEPGLAPGSYVAWLQGSLGPGYRLEAGKTDVGDVFADQGLPSGWTRIGPVRVTRPGQVFVLSSLRKPWWQSGALQGDVLGAIAFVPEGAPPAALVVRGERASALCGKRVDWLERS